MSRWYAPAEEYLTHYDRKANTWRVIAGPFSRSSPAVALVSRSYDLTGQVYGVSSRYSLAKYKVFSRSKSGDLALAAAIERPNLAKQATKLLGKQTATLGGGYDEADWSALDALLVESGLLYKPGPLTASSKPELFTLPF